MHFNLTTKHSQRIYLDPKLHVVFGVTLMAVIGVFSISPAFPAMVKALNISSQEVGLLISVFTIPGVFLMPIIGVFADRFGTKNVLTISLIIFGVSGGLCFFTRDFHSLLLYRFLQGIGAAPLSSLTIALIGDLYTGNKRTEAMGYNQSVFSFGAAGFTAIGGALAMLGWFAPFILPILAIPIAYFVIKISINRKLSHPTPIKLYILSVFKTIKKSHMLVTYSITFVTFILISGAFLNYFPILIGFEVKATSLEVGIIMSSMTIFSALSASQVGKLIHISSLKTLLKISFIFYSISLCLIPFMPNLWSFLLPGALFGTAQGINLPILQTLLGQHTTAENRAIVMSLYGTCLRLGQTTGPLFAGAVYTVLGLKSVFVASAALALFTAGIAPLFIDKSS